MMITFFYNIYFEISLSLITTNSSDIIFIANTNP
jgi:hypothetical protein